MDIIVCMKQVPGTARVDIDENTGVLKREGVEAKMNPYDLYAIETAVRLREEYGGTVRAVTMGPLQAREILKEAFMMGADECALLSDKALAGADVLATSYALSGFIKKLGLFDLIICGKQTTDGDTAQVGAETAEFLDIPHASNVVRIVGVCGGLIRVEVDMSDCILVQDIPFPCLLTVEKDIFTPRLPSYRKKLESAEKEIRVFTLEQLDDRDPEHYGLNGSPTRVERVFPPDASTVRVTVDGTGEEIAEYLYEKLRENKFV